MTQAAALAVGEHETRIVPDLEDMPRKGNSNIGLLIQAARDPTVDIAKLKELRAMIKDDENDWRRAEFLVALAQAKLEFTPIVKTRIVDYPHKQGGGRTSYKYEDLADISDVVTPILSKHGITYSFAVDQSEPPKIKVSCILAFLNGYQDAPRTLVGVQDDSGQKSPNQAIASTITFLERGTLKQALGLAAGRDDDGAGAAVDPTIDADQVAFVEQQLRDTNSDVGKFLETMGAANVAALTVSQFKRGVEMLAAKARRVKEAKP